MLKFEGTLRDVTVREFTFVKNDIEQKGASYEVCIDGKGREREIFKLTKDQIDKNMHIEIQKLVDKKVKGEFNYSNRNGFLNLYIKSISVI